MPSELNKDNEKKQMQKYETVQFEKDGIVVIGWKDKKVVKIISSVHSGEIKEKQRTYRSITIPDAVLEYNQHKNAVDISNQNISYYPCIRTTHKWWKRIFLHLIDVSIANARVIYIKAKGKIVSNLDFRRMIMEEILEKSRPVVPLKGNETKFCSPRSTPAPVKPCATPILDTGVMYGHFPGKFDEIQNCVMCAFRGINRRRTMYNCRACGIPLCIVPCFEQYHMWCYQEMQLKGLPYSRVILSLLFLLR